MLFEAHLRAQPVEAAIEIGALGDRQPAAAITRLEPLQIAQLGAQPHRLRPVRLPLRTP